MIYYHQIEKYCRPFKSVSTIRIIYRISNTHEVHSGQGYTVTKQRLVTLINFLLGTNEKKVILVNNIIGINTCKSFPDVSYEKKTFNFSAKKC